MNSVLLVPGKPTGALLGEVVFGLLFGAFWGSIYEFAFDYRIK